MVIRTDGLTVRYGRHEALTGLTLRIGGGATGLLGPNGAGKTTLVKTLLGFLRPSQGTAELLGIDVRADPHRLRARVGYLPERNTLIPDLTAVEMVALAGELGGLRRATALERAHDVLRFSGLGEARYRPLESLSTGMLQRAKLAAALVHDPVLVLLDEPTSGLDPTGRREMLDLIGDLTRQRGIAALVATHLLHDVESVCNAVALLNRGKLALYGDMAALRKLPHLVYEVGVREEVPGRFAAELASRGLSVSEAADGLLRVLLSQPDPRIFFEIAVASGAELRHLRRFEPSLEDVFLAAVAGGS